MATNKRSGFAAMDRSKHQAISSMGGRARAEKGNGHRFTSETAREAGRKAQAMGTAHRFTQEEAAEAGRKGAAARAAKREAARKAKVDEHVDEV